MDVFYSTPLLHGDGENGKKQWQGFAARTADGVVIYTEFGSVGGTILKSKPTKVEAKHKGAANERDEETQARAEIDAKCVAKQKGGSNYQPVGGTVSAEVAERRTRILPMLAPSELYPKFKSDLQWPCFGQPKLDGMRLVSDGHDFWSRKGELQNEANIRHLRVNTGGLILDGEVLLPPEQYTFQETLSAMKNPKHPLAPELVYCVFDIVDLTLTFEERFAKLKAWVAANPHPRIALVATLELQADKDAREFMTVCVERGMEGIMLRNADGRYQPAKRSRDLQKFKLTDEDEFIITGYREAKGGWAGTPVLELQVSADNVKGFDGKSGQAGAKFEAKPKMSLEESRKLWAIRDTLIGQKATVLFQSYTDIVKGEPTSGTPRFPRVKSIRNYEG